jgi:hypothetical protein
VIVAEKRRRHVADDDDKSILTRMWTNGDVIRAIEAETGLSPSGISAMAKRLGLPPRHTKWPEDHVALVVDETARLIELLSQRTGRSRVSIANHVAEAAMRQKKRETT